ncbi:MAG: hypothetical protein DJ555_03135 [Desulfurococcaceae archaeon]|nr:MAG: hypothetical protein DJ555_03135 [Desulfurococcaceae archaeon]
MILFVFLLCPSTSHLKTPIYSTGISILWFVRDAEPSDMEIFRISPVCLSGILQHDQGLTSKPAY